MERSPVLRRLFDDKRRLIVGCISSSSLHFSKKSFVGRNKTPPPRRSSMETVVYDTDVYLTVGNYHNSVTESTIMSISSNQQHRMSLRRRRNNNKKRFSNGSISLSSCCNSSSTHGNCSGYTPDKISNRVSIYVESPCSGNISKTKSGFSCSEKDNRSGVVRNPMLKIKSAGRKNKTSNLNNPVLGLFLITLWGLIVCKDVKAKLQVGPFIMAVLFILKMFQIMAKWKKSLKENSYKKRSIRSPLQRLQGCVHIFTRPWHERHAYRVKPFGAVTGRLLAAKFAYNQYQELQKNGLRSRMQGMNETYIREIELQYRSRIHCRREQD